MIEAIILAGGFGTRLREVVSDVPKPMAPINGKPFLAYQLENLAKNGVSRIILSVGYMSEKIIEYFGNCYLGMEIVYVVEDQPLGTGGAVKLAIQSCTQDHVYILNGDTFLDVDIATMEELWMADREQIILGVETDDVSRYGSLKVEGGYVVRFSEKSTIGRGLINAGCYLLDTNIFQKIDCGSKFSLEKDYFDKIKNKKIFKVLINNGYFNDIGTPEGYREIQEKFKKK